MPVTEITLSTDIERSPRVLQLEGVFDLPPTKRQDIKLPVNLPVEDFDWNIGLIVGPSGSGKSSVARNLFQAALRDEHCYHWPERESVVDAFPEEANTKEIINLLCSVGFSSPPSWLRPFGKLSTGEKFRVAIARMLAENLPLVVCDEFTSTVDRTVAQIASAAIQKAIRLRKQRFIAVTCHDDVEEWLQPDWVYRPGANEFARRSLRCRPPIELEIHRVTKEAWKLFRHHHYLDTSIHPAGQFFMAVWRGRPVAFSSWISLLIKTRDGGARREHRTVCLPDYQGVGIGNALSDFCASIFKALGIRATSTTSHPAMIASRLKSRNWKLVRKPGFNKGDMKPHQKAMGHSVARLTAGFEYIGPAAEKHVVQELT